MPEKRVSYGKAVRRGGQFMKNALYMCMMMRRTALNRM